MPPDTSRYACRAAIERIFSGAMLRPMTAPPTDSSEVPHDEAALLEALRRGVAMNWALRRVAAAASFTRALAAPILAERPIP